MKTLVALPFAAVLALPASAATTVQWAEWEQIDAFTAVGLIHLGADLVTVTATNTAPYRYVQTSGGELYWEPDAYTNGSVANAPDTTDIVELGDGGQVTFSFVTDHVLDVFFAFVSWNLNPDVPFSREVIVDSVGRGYWTPLDEPVGATSDGATVHFTGEAHGVLKLPGGSTGFSFTSATEDWHGFTIGVAPVPLPASAPLLLGAIGAVAAVRRSRR